MSVRVVGIFIGVTTGLSLRPPNSSSLTGEIHVSSWETHSNIPSSISQHIQHLAKRKRMPARATPLFVLPTIPRAAANQDKDDDTDKHPNPDEQGIQIHVAFLVSAVFKLGKSSNHRGIRCGPDGRDGVFPSSRPRSVPMTREDRG